MTDKSKTYLIIFIGAVLGIILGVLLALLTWPTPAHAAPCHPSAAALREAKGKHAWPKWAYASDGRKCWYAGKKPARDSFEAAPTPLPKSRPLKITFEKPHFPRGVRAQSKIAGLTSIPAPSIPAARWVYDGDFRDDLTLIQISIDDSALHRLVAPLLAFGEQRAVGLR